MADAPRRDIVVVGGSAGGLGALTQLLGHLPADFPGAVHVVLHVAADSPTLLPQLLQRSTKLPVAFARHGASVATGRVVVAPPDHHLMLDADRVRLSHGPRENTYRPSIDVLFRSAAVAYGPRVIGVVLSGLLDDGSAGLWAIRRRGGTALVQDPADADYPDMPRNAIQLNRIDDVLSAARLAERMTQLVQQPVAAAPEAPPAAMTSEVRMASAEHIEPAAMDALGGRSSLTCPECGGALWQLDDAGLSRYRCHVGHAYSLLTLAAEQSIRVEAALWAAMRALEENGRVAHHLASSAGERGEHRRAEVHEERALSSRRHAEVLRELLEQATYTGSAGGPNDAPAT
jgi:two-component system chemotaxis response regulator CheB